MHEYSFVSIPLKRHREGLTLEKDYREVIRDRSDAGWQFIQAIPLEEHTEPRLELVFTRKVRK